MKSKHSCGNYFEGAARRAPYFSLGYDVALLRLAGSDPAMIVKSLEPEELLRRIEGSLAELQAGIAGGCGDSDSGGVVRALASELKTYCVRAQLRLGTRSCGRGPGPAGADPGQRVAEAVDPLVAAFCYWLRRLLHGVPEFSWVRAGMLAARCEWLAVLGEGVSCSESRTVRKKARKGPSRRLAREAGAEDGRQSHRALLDVLEECGLSRAAAEYSLQIAWRKGGQAQVKGVDASFGELRDALLSAIRASCPPFWEERLDGTYRVAGVEVTFEVYLILGALRWVRGAALKCHELIAFTDVSGANNQIAMIRNHPVLRRFVTPCGKRAWTDLAVPLPPQSLVERLRKVDALMAAKN